MLGSHRVVNETQFCVADVTRFMAVNGVSTASPWLIVAPVADVKSNDALNVPVAKVIVEVAPVVTDLMIKTDSTASQVHKIGEPEKPAVILVAASVKLTAVAMLIVNEVLSVPSTVIISVPDSACSCAKVMLAN